MGIVTVGRGNNGEDRTEGAIYKGAIGTYLHGSLLPKNPSLADFLIAKGLQRREEDVGLSELEDSLEWKAHRVAVERSRKTG